MGPIAKPTRQNRAIAVDFHDESTYFQLLRDGKAFVELILAFILSIGFQLTHKATCTGGGCLTRHSHYARGLCRKFCSGGREGAGTPVCGGIRQPESRTVRPQCGPRCPPRPPAVVS